MHSIDFFRDEVRNGFYIPTAIKQAWAMSLDVLAEVDRICKKYNITYYADWGTFLGAVRHGGFIPWDDDLDICMKRDDYIRFRQVCDKELPKHYCIHDYERKEDHWLFLSRVVGNTTICYDEEYLNTHYNFPWLSTVDIFVKDYLYEDVEIEKARDKEVMFLITLADGIREGHFDHNTILHHLYEIKKKYHISLPDIGKVRELCVALYRLAEQQMSKVKPDETDKIGQIFPWILKGNKGELKKKYEKVIRLPFEDTEIPVPAYYHEMLSNRYGTRYYEIVKAGAAHDYPFFEGQKADLEKVNGAPLPEYSFSFDKDMLKRPEVDKSNSLKEIAKECLGELEKINDEIRKTICETPWQQQDGDLIYNELEKLLVDSQQLAVDLGTLIEQVKGEDKQCTKNVIGVLEGYCEDIYKCYQIIEGYRSSGNSTDIGSFGSFGKNIQASIVELGETLDQISESIKTNIIERKEILFITLGPSEWKGFENIYQGLIGGAGKGDVDIYVVPIPLMPKDILGQVHLSEADIQDTVHLSDYPTDIVYSDWQRYDVSQHCPDIIYIQNPYDDKNPYLTVPPVYYAKNLRRYTEKLVFKPFKKTGEFNNNDTSDLYNLKHYAVAPGVIYADEVVVQSEGIKNHYINALSKFAGEETRPEWEEKIIADRCAEQEASDKSGYKKILYCIGADELSEHGDRLLKSVSNRFDIICENREKIKTTITLYPDDRQQWRNIDPDLAETLLTLIDKKVDDGTLECIHLIPRYADDTALEYDAYYGDTSPLVPAFSIQKKPVMIANYDI